MSARALDVSIVVRLLEEAEARLEGEWLLVGGALAGVWFSPDRMTEDIDLILRDDIESRLLGSTCCFGSEQQ